MFQYLDSLDIDEVGYALRTASLMSQPEYHFDPANPGDYALFGIRYLILPATTGPPRSHAARSWSCGTRIPSIRAAANSYISLAETQRCTDRQPRRHRQPDAALPRSAEPGRDRYLTSLTPAPAPPRLRRSPRSARRGGRGRDGPDRPDRPSRRPGHRHRKAARTGCRRAERVLRPRLVSHDRRAPHPSPDDHPRPHRRRGTAGTHHVAFRYTGFGGYPELLALAVISLLLTAAVTCHGEPTVRRRPGSRAAQRHVAHRTRQRTHLRDLDAARANFSN